VSPKVMVLVNGGDTLAKPKGVGAAVGPCVIMTGAIVGERVAITTGLKGLFFFFFSFF